MLDGGWQFRFTVAGLQDDSPTLTALDFQLTAKPFEAQFHLTEILDGNRQRILRFTRCPERPAGKSYHAALKQNTRLGTPLSDSGDLLERGQTRTPQGKERCHHPASVVEQGCLVSHQ